MRRGATGTHRVALRTSQESGLSDIAQKPITDEAVDCDREKEVVEGERVVTIAETGGETELGAATSNDLTRPDQIHTVLPVNHACGADGSGTVSRCGNVARAARGRWRKCNQDCCIQD